MKKLKLIPSIITILMFSNLLFAGNPESIANKKVALLSKDIVMTDSQKIFVFEKAKIFAVKIQNINALTNGEAKNSALNQASQEYKAALDSILAFEQKAQLITKRNERRNSVMNKLKSK